MKFIIEHSALDKKQLKTTNPSEQSKKDGSHCFYNITNPSNKIQCDDCRRDISKSAKILAEQSDYCMSCFANREDILDDYNVINKLDYPLFDEDWTADEELMLFEGLQKHGFGNWGEIADCIGTNKTREDVEVHYITFFLDSVDFIPKANIITHRNEEGFLIQTGIDDSIKKNPKPMTRVFSSHSIQSYQRGSLTVNQMTAGMKTGGSPTEIVGYMPKRGDFEVQFDNDAELLLAQMEFNEDDSEEEKQMKFRLIDIYNQKLTERVRRKEFVISRKLLDLKEQIRLDKTRTKEEKEIYNMMKVFARFSSPEEHEQLVQGIIKEKQIRVRLEELKEFKKKGFRSIADLSQQLEGKKQKEEKIKKDPIFLASDRQKMSTPVFTQKRSKKEISLQKQQNRSPFPNSQQQQLCNRFNISLSQFQIIKFALVRQSLKQGIVEFDSASKLFKTNRSSVERILDFFVQKQELLSNWKESEQLF